jgi:hypothetical protein
VDVRVTLRSHNRFSIVDLRTLVVGRHRMTASAAAVILGIKPLGA